MNELLIYLQNLRNEITEVQSDRDLNFNKILDLQKRELELFEMFLKAYIIAKGK